MPSATRSAALFSLSTRTRGCARPKRGRGRLAGGGDETSNVEPANVSREGENVSRESGGKTTAATGRRRVFLREGDGVCGDDGTKKPVAWSHVRSAGWSTKAVVADSAGGEKGVMLSFGVVEDGR